jgi:hypothetical protein
MHRKTSLLGVVLNVLLAWPDTCFRDELVRHPRTKQHIDIEGKYNSESAYRNHRCPG